MAVAIVLLMVVSVSGDDPITIKLEGTTIDALPDSVEIFVSNPREAAEVLVKKGGTRDEITKDREDIPVDLVRYHRVDYLFKTPESAAPHGSNHQFKLGDIVYVFNLKTQEEAQSFAKRYLLEKKGTIAVGPGRTKDLYTAKPGYFVFFPIKTTIYYCPLDPGQESDMEGKCPICGMPFVRATTYR